MVCSVVYSVRVSVCVAKAIDFLWHLQGEFAAALERRMCSSLCIDRYWCACHAIKLEFRQPQINETTMNRLWDSEKLRHQR